MKWQERIKTNTLVCQGMPCVAGTRITAALVLDTLAEGVLILAGLTALSPRSLLLIANHDFVSLSAPEAGETL